MNELKLGNTIECMVTGFRGIATAKAEYLNGCVQLCIMPKCADGKNNERQKGHYIDTAQLKFIDEGIASVSISPSDGPEFTLGQNLKCRASGFEGIAVGRYTSMSGAVEYSLDPKIKKDGEMSDSTYIDRYRLELVDNGILVKKKDTGGPMRNCPVRD